MTRFVYVLPAGRFRWEVRVEHQSPRVARSTADLSAGQTVAFLASNGQWVIDEFTGRPDEWNLNRNPLVILSEPDPATESLFYRRKAHALIAARAIAILIGGEVQPHDRRGRIQDPDSYGNDPRESRG